MSRGWIYLRLVLATVVWGSIFHLGVYAVKFMNPLAVGAWRFVLAAVMLLPIVQLRESWPWTALRRNAWALVAMALSGIFIFNAAMFYGLRATSAVNAALIMALSPAMTTVLNSALQRRAVAWLQWLGLICGLAGVVCIVSGGSWSALLHLQLSRGDALMLLASICWSLYAVIPGRFVHGLSAQQMSAGSILIGALLLAALALYQNPTSMRIPSMTVATVLLYMALFGSVLALTWWNEAIQELGATRATLFMNLVPLSAAVISILMGQALSWADFVGAALVMTGVSVAVLQHQ